MLCILLKFYLQLANNNSNNYTADPEQSSSFPQIQDCKHAGELYVGEVLIEFTYTVVVPLIVDCIVFVDLCFLAPSLCVQTVIAEGIIGTAIRDTISEVEKRISF